MTIIFSFNCSDTKANSRRLKTFSGVRGTLNVNCVLFLKKWAYIDF